MSFTEIAIEMAQRIAGSRGCELESFSLDGVDILTDEQGAEVIKIQATAQIAPPRDEVPFDVVGNDPEAELAPFSEVP